MANRINAFNGQFAVTPEEMRLYATYLNDMRRFSDELQQARRLLQSTVSVEVWEMVQVQVPEFDQANVDVLAKIRKVLRTNCGGCWSPFREEQSARDIDAFRPFRTYHDYFEATTAFKRFMDERISWQPEGEEVNPWVWPEYRQRAWWTSRLKAPELQDLREAIRADDRMTLKDVRAKIQKKMVAMRDVFMEDAERDTSAAAMVAAAAPKLVPAVVSPLAVGESPRRQISATKLAAIKCYNCGQLGHFSDKCPVPRRSFNGSSVRCYRCQGLGHSSRDCPNGGRVPTVPHKSSEKRSFAMIQGKNGETRRVPTAQLAMVFDAVRASEEAEMAASAVQDHDDEERCYDVADFDVSVLDQILPLDPEEA
jgi:hypothetical protein